MRRTALAVAAFTCLIPGGCMTVAQMGTPTSDSGTFAYAAGRATQDFTYPPLAMQSAVTGAMEDMRMHSIRQANEGGLLVFHGRTADDRHGVTVTLRPNQGKSRVHARVGWFGDEPLSRALMDRIGVRLGSLPPAAIPVEPPSSPEGNPFFSKKAIPDEIMLRDEADAAYRDSPVP